MISRKKYQGIIVIVFILIALIFSLLNKDGISQCVTSLSLKKCFFLGLTLFEWLQLAAAPILLTLGGYFANRFLKSLEKEKERDRQKTLKDYFDQTTKLLLEINWPQSHLHQKNVYDANNLRPDGEIEKIFSIIRAITLAVLQELDGARKSLVLDFLIESKVIPYMSLKSADLSGVTLLGAQLERVDLREANLQGANLKRTNLSQSNLSGANLIKANLTEVKLVGACLFNTRLSRSILLRADLQYAMLSGIEQIEENGNPLSNPYLCNTRLPEKISDEMHTPLKVNWNRDFNQIPSALVKQGHSTSVLKARELVEELCKIEWPD